jgi:hypothetical protein
LSSLGVNFLVTNDFLNFVNLILAKLGLEAAGGFMGAAAVGAIAIAALTTTVIIIYDVWNNYSLLAASPQLGRSHA